MLAGNHDCSPLSAEPKQSAWRRGGEHERMPANLGGNGQYQTSELGVGGSNPSRCAIVFCLAEAGPIAKYPFPQSIGRLRPTVLRTYPPTWGSALVSSANEAACPTAITN